MQKVVLKVDVRDDGKCKQKAMKMVSVVPGLESISMDMKEQKLTLTGDMDPVEILSTLRKVYHAEIISVGPAKKKEEPKKDEPKKKEEPKKKDEPKNQAQLVQVTHLSKACPAYPPCDCVICVYPRRYCFASVEEDPTACVIL